MKTYQAWTKKEGKTEQIYTELICNSEQEFKERMIEKGLVVCSKIFLKDFNKEKTVYYQSKSRFNNTPVQVVILSVFKKTAKVKSLYPEKTFRCRLTSLYN